MFTLLYHPAANDTQQLPPQQLKKQETLQAAQNTSVNETPQTEAPQPEAQVAVHTQPTGDKYDLMRAAGIPERDWSAVDYIVSKESSWRHNVWNTAGSGAYGLCQALPATKMASAGEDYMTNPVTQLRWCHQYAESRYDGWHFASTFWQSNRWW